MLWFLSLVFSVAAALFGILVKQWIREYLRWNSVLGTARDNVLLRQVRSEAWDDWKVPAIISAIPALLEIGVILFFAGMIVFLWTLETSVAIVVSIAVGVFLSVAILVTILPVLSRRCPYKSPTGWAFVVLVRSLQRLIARIVDAEIPEALQKLRHWRERDLEAIGSAPSEDISDVRSNNPRDMKIDRADLDFLEIIILGRALQWFLRGSPGPGSLKSISHCVQSMHTRRSHPTWIYARSTVDETHLNRVSTIITLCVFYRKSNMCDLIHGLTSQSIHVQLDSPLEEVRAIGYHSWRWDSFLSVGLWNPFLHEALRRGDPTINIESQIICRLALYELRAQIERWISRSEGFTSTDSDTHRSIQPVSDNTLDVLVDGVIFLLYVLVAEVQVSNHAMFQDLAFLQELSNVLTEVCRALVSNPVAHRTGLTTIIYQALCLIGTVELVLTSEGALSGLSFFMFVDYVFADQFQVELSPMRKVRSGITWPGDALALSAHLHNHVNTEEGRHLFVMMSDFTMLCTLCSPISPTEMQDILEKLFPMMLSAAETSLSTSELNCGTYVHLPWVDHLLIALESNCEAPILEGRESVYRTVVLLLLALVRNQHAGLVTGEHIRIKLDRCLNTLNEDHFEAFGVEYILEDSIVLRDPAYLVDWCTRPPMPLTMNSSGDDRMKAMPANEMASQAE